MHLKINCNLLILFGVYHVFPELLAKNTLLLFAESVRVYNFTIKEALFSSSETLSRQLSLCLLPLGKTMHALSLSHPTGLLFFLFFLFFIALGPQRKSNAKINWTWILYKTCFPFRRENKMSLLVKQFGSRYVS